MKIVVDYQEVEMSSQEAKYFQELTKSVGSDCFRDLFSVDDSGIISIIKPKKTIPWVVIHFVQQLQINQHLRANDKEIEDIKERLKKIERSIDVKNFDC